MVSSIKIWLFFFTPHNFFLSPSPISLAQDLSLYDYYNLAPVTTMLSSFLRAFRVIQTKMDQSTQKAKSAILTGRPVNVTA